MTAAATAAGVLFCLATRFTASRRRVTPLLEKLLFTRGENKLLTAVAAGQ
jgi:hypothetical protein